jgi:hypothetical protein
MNAPAIVDRILDGRGTFQAGAGYKTNLIVLLGLLAIVAEVFTG